MTLRHMKIFVAVYQQKSITLASNSLHLAQPSVSLAIKELEEYYHIRLFDRLSRRIYPTENGHRFYEYALHIVSLFSEMENKIPAWDANAPAPYWLQHHSRHLPAPLPCQSLSGTAPGNQNLCNGQKYRHNRAGSRRQSAGFCPGRRHCHSPGNHFRGLFCRYALHGHSSRPSACRQPDGHPRRRCFLPPPFTRTRQCRQGNRRKSLFLSGGIQIAPAWESVSTLALIRAAQNGLGIAILPELLVRDALKSGDLVSLPLPPDILTRSLYLIRHRNKYLSSSAEEFQNLCRMWKF